MKSNRKVGISYAINLVLALAVFLILNHIFSAQILSNTWRDLTILVCIYAILAVSLNLSTGLLGELCLGHAGFMSVGAYTAALIMIGQGREAPLPVFLAALLTGGLMAALFGFLVGIPALRLRGDYLAIITLAFGELIKIIVRSLKITGGGQPLTGIPLITKFSHVYWILIVLIVVVYTLIRSRHGRAIISIREDDIAAEASGINTTRYKITAFTLSAFFAGVAGGLFAHFQGILESNMFDYNESINIMVMVVLGGMGSITGSVLSASVLTVLPEVLRGFASYRTMIYAVILIVLMLFKPSGLLGQKEISQQFFIDLFRRKVKDPVPVSGVGGSSVTVQENLPAKGTPGEEADSQISARYGLDSQAPEELDRKWKGKR